MNTTLKPLSSGSPQNTNAAPPAQINKPMHPQGPPGGATTYGQPVGGGHMMHPNTNVAHSHPAQQNHYSMNVPNTGPGHYMGQIPSSNHPVANPSASAAGQMYSPQKTAAQFMAGYQPNLGHPPNQNILPPVTQSLPASSAQQTQQNQQQNVGSAASQQNQHSKPMEATEKPQPNGTPEVTSVTPQNIENSQNHNMSQSPLKEKIPQPSPAPVPQTQQVPQVDQQQAESDKPAVVPPQTPAEPPQTPETPESNSVPTPPASNSESSSSSPVTTQNVDSTSQNGQQTSAESATLETAESKAKSTEETLEEKENETKTETEDTGSEISNTSSAPAEQENSATPQTDSEQQSEPKSTEQSPAKRESSPPKSTLATRSPVRKSRTPKPEETPPKVAKEQKTPTQKSPSTGGKNKRQRTRTQPYQSPLPEIEIITKISSSTPRSRNSDDKLIVFYKNEHLAVRNAEGSFYLCQAVQNVYKTSSKIKIRWLSQDKEDKTGEIYTPDFYDLTDFDCILTNLSLSRVEKGKYRLPPAEKERTESILKRSLAVEKGEVTSPSLTEEHPDGLDLSLLKDEEQFNKRKGTKRKAGRSSSRSPSKKQTPTKKSPSASKVRKASPSKPVKKTPAKATPAKKTPPVSETKKASSSATKSAKGKKKSSIKSSPVVDQKKAKVLAKIGRKSAVLAAKTPIPSTPKSSKVAAKATPASAKRTPAKASTSTASAKSTPSRGTRRSTRK